MLKVLSIDDSKAVHAFLSNIFDSFSTQVWHAYSGVEGLATVEQLVSEGLELILLDWEMPGLTGIETLKKIRELGIKVPIVMLTSKNAPEDIILALSGGANEYVMKPFTKDILIEKLEAVLGRKLV